MINPKSIRRTLHERQQNFKKEDGAGGAETLL